MSEIKTTNRSVTPAKGNCLMTGEFDPVVVAKLASATADTMDQLADTKFSGAKLPEGHRELSANSKALINAQKADEAKSEQRANRPLDEVERENAPNKPDGE